MPSPGWVLDRVAIRAGVETLVLDVWATPSAGMVSRICRGVVEPTAVPRACTRQDGAAKLQLEETDPDE
jgi:hypothetical protein